MAQGKCAGESGCEAAPPRALGCPTVPDGDPQRTANKLLANCRSGGPIIPGTRGRIRVSTLSADSTSTRLIATHRRAIEGRPPEVHVVSAEEDRAEPVNTLKHDGHGGYIALRRRELVRQLDHRPKWADRRHFHDRVSWSVLPCEKPSARRKHRADERWHRTHTPIGQVYQVEPAAADDERPPVGAPQDSVFGGTTSRSIFGAEAQTSAVRPQHPKL